MKKNVLPVLLFAALCACSPLNQDADPDPRPDDRTGDPVPDDSILEGLSWWELLRNCKPDVDTPGNILDIGMDIFNLSDSYIPGMIRKCLQKKLSDAHNKICDARIKLERKRENAESDTDKARVENSIIKLDTTHFKLNAKLYELALRLDDKTLRARDKEGSPNQDRMDRAWQWFLAEEGEAVRDILDTESYSTCHSYTEEE